MEGKKGDGAPTSQVDSIEPDAISEETQDVEHTPIPGAVTITAEQRAQVAKYYGNKAQDDHIAPSSDVSYIVDRIMSLTEERAIEILVDTIREHQDDPNFPAETMRKIRLLVQGPKLAGGEFEDYDFDLKAEAAVIYYHSPYPEVRSVTDACDDPDSPAETFRAYFLGLVFMAGSSAINTFFSPRQPAISIGAIVLQLLIFPCGRAWAEVVPDWGFTLRGARYSLNPGPWTFKEQMFATIIFSVGNTAGASYYVYLVQRLPQYLGYRRVRFGYEICLAFATQLFGLGFAGILRRFVVYPQTAIWPKVLPTLALNRALLLPEAKENINGWTVSRYRFFMLAFVGMFFYFFIPNFLFTGVRSFNWMTWISPNNFTLATITGFWGGMGFNPLPTFDWNVASGTPNTILVTPFFSAVQQYAAGILSGLIIIGMYWGNMYWSGYMPINSNEAFDNTGYVYQVNNILDPQTNSVDKEKYRAYGPPYFSGANIFGQGAWFAWYPMTLFYQTIINWTPIKVAFVGMGQSLFTRKPIHEQHPDPHTRMMSKYKEVPDWWFLAILALCLMCGIIALTVWPVDTPIWSLFAIMGISLVLLIPSAIMQAVANARMGFNVIFQLLAGVWFAGNPEANVIVTCFGQNFDYQSDSYITCLKMAHYAKLPPRAVFRAQVLSVILNCFIFVGMLDWMVESYNNGTLCEWNNSQHFVCTDAVLVFASAIEYGAFGVKNMFELYPILPYCFLIGSAIGIIWGLARMHGSRLRDFCRRRFSETRFLTTDHYLFRPLAMLKWFDPSVFWAGSLNWTGGNNLSYSTVWIYLSFIFMYHIKRHYGAWWEKYNYLLEAGLDVGVAVSSIVQTLAFDFGSGVTLNWWGNTVSQAGVDYVAYNQNASLLAIPKEGFFGLSPDQYPMKW